MSAKLTELEIKNANARAKKYTMADGEGLMLLVMPNGARYWRFRYRFGGRARSVVVGKPYPGTTLKQARILAMGERALLLKGLDPAEQRRARKQAKAKAVANTFGVAANKWHEHRSKAWSPRTAELVRGYLDRDMLPKLASRPLDNITPLELVKLLDGIEARNALDIVKKTRQWLKSIYAFARVSEMTHADPAKDLNVLALPGRGPRHYAYLPPDELGGFLHALEADSGADRVKACLWMSLWTANRPGVTRTLRWAELDLDNGIWTIEKDRDEMKRGYFHLTPLPYQAVAMLRALHSETGQFEHVFIGRNDPTVPISDGAVAGLIKRIGYRHKQTAHGFRHMISTALNEMGYESDWIEKQLAHGDPDKIRRIYNKADWLKPRAKMMQAWADHLDELYLSSVSKPKRPGWTGRLQQSAVSIERARSGENIFWDDFEESVVIHQSQENVQEKKREVPT